MSRLSGAGKEGLLQVFERFFADFKCPNCIESYLMASWYVINMLIFGCYYYFWCQLGEIIFLFLEVTTSCPYSSAFII